MPSFDVVSELDMHEVNNAVDQANREVATRFDFKGTDSKFNREQSVVTLQSESELSAALEALTERTAMVVGAAGSGKTWLARRLVEKLAEEEGRPALISADMGQPVAR